MRKALFITIALSAAASLSVSVWALCNPVSVEELWEVNECSGNYRFKKEFWQATFNQNYDRYKDRLVTGTAIVSSCSSTCYPGFDIATVQHGRDSSGRQTWKWTKNIRNKTSACETFNTSTFEMHHTCPSELADGGCTTPGFDGTCPPGTYPNGSGMCCSGACDTYTGSADTTSTIINDSSLAPPSDEPCLGNGIYDPDICTCVSPVLVDTAGDGFELSDAAHGLSFDITADGQTEQISWTLADTDDAWLALDRNSNGRIDDGRELFGNFTPQPRPADGAERNGFLALAVYDLTGNGGNADGVIDERDAIYAGLRLWLDTNHDGVSEAAELHTLAVSDVTAIELNHRESKRVDEEGNAFRYRAKVEDAKGARTGRWAWDVFLKTAR